jgi:hypothetical protein
MLLTLTSFHSFPPSTFSPHTCSSFLPSSFLFLSSTLYSFPPFIPSSVSFCPSDCFSHTDTHIRHPNESPVLLIIRALPNVFVACSNRMFSKYLHSGGLSEMSVCMNTLPYETKHSKTANLPESLNFDTFSDKILCQISHIFLKLIGLRQHVIYAAATQPI